MWDKHRYWERILGCVAYGNTQVLRNSCQRERRVYWIVCWHGDVTVVNHFDKWLFGKDENAVILRYSICWGRGSLH